MKYLIYTIFLVLLLGVNIGLFTPFKLAGAVPNLLLIAVVFFALEKESLDFFFIALVGGLLMDFYSGAFAGSFTLSFLVIGLILHLMINNLLVFEVNWKYLAIVSALSIAACNLLLWAYNFAFYKLDWGTSLVSGSVLQARFLPELAYTLALLYPMYLATNFTRAVISNIETKRRNSIS